MKSKDQLLRLKLDLRKECLQVRNVGLSLNFCILDRRRDYLIIYPMLSTWSLIMRPYLVHLIKTKYSILLSTMLICTKMSLKKCQVTFSPDFLSTLMTVHLWVEKFQNLKINLMDPQSARLLPKLNLVLITQQMKLMASKIRIKHFLEGLWTMASIKTISNNLWMF